MAKEPAPYKFTKAMTGCWITEGVYTQEEITQKMLDFLGIEADAELRLAIEGEDPDGILFDAQDELIDKLNAASEGGLSWEFHDGGLYLLEHDECFICEDTLNLTFEGEAIRCKDYDGEDSWICPRCLKVRQEGAERLRPATDPDGIDDTPDFSGKDPRQKDTLWCEACGAEASFYIDAMPERLLCDACKAKAQEGGAL